MEFKDVVAVSGMGGLFEMVAQRPDGILIQPLGGTKKKFASNRIHTFSPLDKIGIYTLDGDSLPLEDVMRNIKKYEEEGNTVVSANSSSNDLKDFFSQVMEDYDDERVYVSDIKKVVKWYQILAEHDLIQEKAAAEEEEASEDKQEIDESEEETSTDGDTDTEDVDTENDKSEEE